MDEALYKLMAWLSPAYPVGAFAYSHGLERAVADGVVHDAGSTQAWIADCLECGAGRTDAIMLAHSWRAAGSDDPKKLCDIAALGLALAPSAERLAETRDQGEAFASVTGNAWGTNPFPGAPYPVAIGIAAANASIPLAATLQAYLQAFATNLVSAAVRLVPLGQTQGQRIVADLAECIGLLTDETMGAPLASIGGCAALADIASMNHETQEPRLFRS